MTQKALNQAADLEIRDTVSRLIDDSAINYEESNYEAGRRDALIDNGKALFIAGAKWRIDSVWHNANKEPKHGEYFLYENVVHAYHVDGIYPSEDEPFVWGDYVKDWGLIRWAYIKDLVPNIKINYGNNSIIYRIHSYRVNSPYNCRRVITYIVCHHYRLVQNH